jgi:hypothetical protein
MVLAQIMGVGMWMITITPVCDLVTTGESYHIDYVRPEECYQDAKEYNRMFPLYHFECIKYPKDT